MQGNNQNISKTTKKKKKRLTWRSWHKWAGLLFAFFVIMFCLSGIVLNHRQMLSHCEASRWWMPQEYRINHWNQNTIKGTLVIGGDSLLRPSSIVHRSSSVLAYGQYGVWLTDRQFKSWKDMNAGLDEGVDNRKISNVVEDGDGTLWCAAQWDVYKARIKWKVESGKWKVENCEWQKVVLPGNTERVSDITLRGGDTIVVATRSALYQAVAPHYTFRQLTLRNPQGYKAEYTMFKTIWMLHSGELFGITGKIVVDILAIVIIILCLTGIAFFTLRYTKRIRQRGAWMKWNLKWHNRLGASLIILTILLAVTGACLRPPLMIPFVMVKTAPVPYSTMDSGNAYHDKIRAIRWDDRLGLWLMSTSEGFYAINSDIDKATPVQIPHAPQISPMGITVFTENPADSTEWLIGSFSGLDRWNPVKETITPWFDDVKSSSIPTASGHAVTGFTTDYQPSPNTHQPSPTTQHPSPTTQHPTPVIFQYSDAPETDGAPLPEMPEVLKSQPMSLWNLALEVHTGRIYSVFLGSILSVLFVFISGLLLTLILVSGYIIYRRSSR